MRSRSAGPRSRVGALQELHARGPHPVDRRQDVVRGERDVLHARPAVELQVLVDLRLAPALRRLVERELHLAGAVRDDLRHQRRVLGRDVVADELGHVGEAHDPVVEVGPLVHALDVADAVVDRLEEPLLRRLDDRAGGLEPRQVGAGVVGAVDQRVPGLAVGGDGGDGDLAVVVLQDVRLLQARRTLRDRVPVGVLDVRDLDREVHDPVAVLGDVPADRGARLHRAAEHEPGPARLQHVHRLVRASVLRAPVRDPAHPERGRVVVGGLLGVADGEDDGVHTLDRKLIHATQSRHGPTSCARVSCNAGHCAQ